MPEIKKYRPTTTAKTMSEASRNQLGFEIGQFVHTVKLRNE